MKQRLAIALLLLSQTVFSQFHFGVFAGGANYIGDLNDKLFKRTKFAAGPSLSYEVSDRFMIRSGITIGKVEGSDQYSGSTFLKQNRNLSFTSDLLELSLVGELTAFNLYNIRWSPYVFGGIALYHFNPYVLDSGTEVNLQPLGTEGQGLVEYPDRKPYALTQFAIPFGGGIKYNLTENVRLGLEAGFRRLFTDYLDDVSSTYADPSLLLLGKGPDAVRFAYRGDEVPGETAVYPDAGYPIKDAQRGNAKTKDWYYFTGLHLTFRLGSGYNRSAAGTTRRGFDCPTL